MERTTRSDTIACTHERRPPGTSTRADEVCVCSKCVPACEKSLSAGMEIAPSGEQQPKASSFASCDAELADDARHEQLNGVLVVAREQLVRDRTSVDLQRDDWHAVSNNAATQARAVQGARGVFDEAHVEETGRLLVQNAHNNDALAEEPSPLIH